MERRVASRYCKRNRFLAIATGRAVYCARILVRVPNSFCNAMSVIGQTGSGVEIEYFDERVGDVSCLEAVVVRRAEGLGMQTIPVFSRRGLTSINVFWRSFFIPRLRNRNVEPPAFEPIEPLPDGFNSAVGEGPTRVLFSRSMRKVRFGDVDYPLATEGLTTVILVDDRCVPRCVTMRTVPAPSATRVPMGRALAKSDMLARITSAHRLTMAAWAQALVADPVIREFTHGTLPAR